MSNIKRLKDKDGNYIYPVTHASAVFDSEGNTIEDKLDEVKQIYVDVEGTYISIDNSSDYLKDIEILGNTVQDASNLADIRSVGDKVEGQELYEIPILSVGKNLLDKSLFNRTSTNNVVRYEAFYDIKHFGFKHMEYKFKRSSGNNIQCLVYTYDGSGKEINTYYFYDATEYTFSLTNTEIEKIKIIIRPEKNNIQYNNNVEDYFNNSYDLMIFEDGNSSYEPYQEEKLTILSPVQLEKVGDVRDRIICKNGVWGVEKNVENYIFKGNEINNSQGTIKDVYLWYWRDANVVLKNKKNIATVVHTKLPHKKGGTDNSGYEAITFNATGNNLLIDIKQPTLNEANEFISGSKLMYVLETPTFIPLPHDQQVKLRTFASKTNIHFETEIEGTIKAQVPKSIGATVNTHTEQINNLNKELDRVKKLEESTVSTITTESGFTTVEETSNGYFEAVNIEGKTLVNLYENKDKTYNASYIINSSEVLNLSLLKPNTKYTLIAVGSDRINQTSLCNSKTSQYFYLRASGNTCVFTTPNDFSLFTDPIRAYVYAKNSNPFIEGEEKNIKVILLEGDHTQNPPSYFEGLMSVGQDVDEVSVESVNENLFDKNIVRGDNQWTPKIKVKKGCEITTYADIMRENQSYAYINEYDCNGSLLIKGANLWETPRKLHPNTEYIELQTSLEIFNTLTVVEGNHSLYNYIPHQSNKKPLLYYNPTTETWGKPILRQWDSIEKHSDGKYYYHKMSNEIKLSESEKWGVIDITTNENLLCFRFPHYNHNAKNSDCICDTLIPILTYNTNIEGIHLHSNGWVYVFIDKSKLSTQDVEGFKAWLQANPVTVVYQLAQEEVYECTNIDLITYEDETNYIINAGAIAPKSTLQVMSNISNVVRELQQKVSNLENYIQHVMIDALNNALNG